MAKTAAPVAEKIPRRVLKKSMVWFLELLESDNTKASLTHRRFGTSMRGDHARDTCNNSSHHEGKINIFKCFRRPIAQAFHDISKFLHGRLFPSPAFDSSPKWPRRCSHANCYNKRMNFSGPLAEGVLLRDGHARSSARRGANFRSTAGWVNSGPESALCRPKFNAMFDCPDLALP